MRRRDYSQGRPSPADIFLVIEISDSSLAYDRGDKARLFATAGVANYWFVNIPGSCVELFRQPEGNQYTSRRAFRAPAELRPLAFPHVSLPLDLLFPAADRG